MEKLSIFFLIIIAAYFFYSLIKIKSKKEKRIAPEQNILEDKKAETDYYRYVIVAAIEAVMHKSRYRIKSVLLTSETEQRYSLWKIFGRQENMMRRTFFNRK